MKHNYPKRGDVHWVRLDPADGKEIKKTRPCVVISSDIANRSELVVVAPITSSVERVFARIEVKVTINGRSGKVLPRQMRSIDRVQRLGDKICSLSPAEITLVNDAIRLILDL